MLKNLFESHLKTHTPLNVGYVDNVGNLENYTSKHWHLNVGNVGNVGNVK